VPDVDRKSVWPRRAEEQRVAIGSLCWGQTWAWRQQQLPASRRALTLLLRRLIPLPDGTPTDVVKRALERSIMRHGVLRSTFFLNSAGVPQQRVWSPSTSRWPFKQFDSVDESTAWLAHDMDIASDWPVRAAIIRGGAHIWLGVAAHHIAADRYGFNLLCSELRTSVRADLIGTEPGYDEAGRPALDIAIHECSGAGKTTSANAVAYWQRHMNDLDRTICLLSAGGHLPNDTMYVVRTRIASALPHLFISRAGGGPAAVAVASIAVAIGRFLRLDRVAMTVVSPNRHLFGVRNSVCSLAQNGLCVVEVPKLLLTQDVVANAWTGLLRAQMSAYLDVRDLEKAIADAGIDRAGFLMMPPNVNIRLGDGAGFLEGGDTDDIFPMVSTTVVDRPCAGLNFHVLISESEVVLELRAGTHLISEEDSRELLRTSMGLSLGI
jgi:hypothetical protein